jgi:ribosome maturation factor RimP
MLYSWVADSSKVPEWACAHFLFLRALLASVASGGTERGIGRRSLRTPNARWTMQSERLATVRAAAERVARSYGLEIYDVHLRRESIGTVLRVIIDRPDRGVVETPEDAVGIEDCQRVSRDLSAVLDVEEDDLGESTLGQRYTLEVSSPGLDRALRHEADYRRFAGRLAKIVTSEPLNGQSAFSGRIVGVEEGVVVLNEGRRTHRVPVAAIKRGHLAVEF